MKRELISQVDPKSPVSEVFRALRTNLQFMNRSKNSQTILITSTVQAEGKSWTTANLATTFAQTGRRVVIVDADMRKPRQHKIFSCKMCPGLSNYLSEINEIGKRERINFKDCIQATEVENLFLLPSGNIPPNPSELLLSENLEELIRDLSNEFDVVLFDGAPCLLVTDSTIISRMVGATVLVASYKYTKIDDLKQAKKRIKSVGGNLVGVVLNRVEISSKKYANKYYYADTTMPNTALSRAKEIFYNDRNEFKEYKKAEPKEKVIKDYIEDKVSDTEKRIKEEIKKENGKRFSTIQEVPSDKAKEILEGIKNF